MAFCARGHTRGRGIVLTLALSLALSTHGPAAVNIAEASTAQARIRSFPHPGNMELMWIGWPGQSSE